MTSRTAVAAVDLGASGGRVMLGVIRGRDQLELHELHRFPNVPVRVLGTLHWDILSLFQGVLDGIRVNGINPDGVVRGSGIFAGGWGAQRAAVYGIPESELGAFYAKRTLLGREVLPEHVAAAVFVLTAGELSLTTGLHIPVDAGVAAAFLR